MSKRRIAHIEIPAKTPKESAEFYQKLFGWTYTHMGEMDYYGFESDGGGGGFPAVNENSPLDRVMLYIDSPDIEADLKAIESSGGKRVVPKSEIPGMGWFAVFTDPAGNHVGLYEAMQQS